MYAASNKWYILDGTTVTQMTVSTISMLSSSVSTLTASNIQTNLVSSLAVNASSILAYNTLRVGLVSTINPIQYNGLFGNYNNTVLAEVSTGVGTQEFLVFKGSSASDRIRFQTTGNFVVETGIAARLWPTVTSNATPAMIINTSSNVGIQTATPTTTLDVNGTGRFTTVSTQNLIVSTVNALNISSVLGNISSLIVNSLQLGDGTGWVSMGPLQTVAVSSIQANANSNTALTTSTLALNISSINGLGAFPSAYVSIGKLNANLTVTRITDTIIPWLVDADPYGWLQNAGTNTARVIPTVPGYYQVSFQVWWGTGTGTDQVNMQARRNTGTFMINQQAVNTVNGMTQNQTKIVYMNGTTDYIDFQVYTATSGANQTIQYGGSALSPGTFYSVSLIR